ncbi:hypothetical protein OSCT_2594 [Oscillochloris trichoides DG-6]|uniref:Uncharacterized protein n=1 Tax=Oscillochloris trichoides DG-6 TaxID=765420 RepID=E1IGZ3_9CHLR|nr:hypothetical protein [Oscillochloris trichoides]EFO79468.1 hypothetical protein OSCT_2594 [Oscillochloris trichoides DG-6]
MSKPHHTKPGADPQSVAAGHELQDANVSPLAFSVVGLFGVLVGAFIFIAVLMGLFGSNPTETGNALPEPTAIQQQLPPAPRLEQNPLVDGTQIMTTAQQRLSSYGWVDEAAGTAHIPIDRAMELLLERGIDGQ